MTIIDEGKQIRSEVSKLRPDKRRRYPDELRAQILDWVGRATAAGMTEHECARAIGVKTWRLTLWRRAMMSKPISEPLALVRVEVPTTADTVGLCLVAPSADPITPARASSRRATARTNPPSEA